MIHKYAEIFCWKNVSSFCNAKATHIFSAKNIRILYTESAKIVNEMTLNELVKLMMLWTTGPRSLQCQCTHQVWWKSIDVYSSYHLETKYGWMDGQTYRSPKWNHNTLPLLCSWVKKWQKICQVYAFKKIKAQHIIGKYPGPSCSKHC